MTSARTSGLRRIVFVHAHPDDETLSTGGTMAHYAASGVAVTLVTCTLGEQGEVIPPELGGLVAEEADQLGGYRIGELAAACAALGVTDHRFLGGAGRWRDSGMALAGHGVRAATPEVLHPRAFARPESFAEQVEQLVALLAELRPEVVVTYAADGGYGHPDHVRAHDVTVAAVARVPARLFHHVTARGPLEAALARITVAPPMRAPAPDDLPSVPDELVTTRIDVRAQRASVVAAMRAHVTQVIVASDDVYSVSNLVAQPVPDVDAYVAAEGVAAAADDLFGVAP